MKVDGTVLIHTVPHHVVHVVVINIKIATVITARGGALLKLL